ncbi:MAG: twin-arginine translocation signal domain-containing protein, partial [Planctomycetales bacterium]|nr:twin-arginine translocation signal domain-containing protein [Planctomycetales bacterium]
MDRRDFLRAGAAAGASVCLGPAATALAQGQGEPLFKISLAEWSLHRSLNRDGSDNLRFPEIASKQCGIQAVEYVNQFFMDKAQDQTYLGEMKKRAA